jgi:hypothetical protein
VYHCYKKNLKICKYQVIILRKMLSDIFLISQIVKMNETFKSLLLESNVMQKRDQTSIGY